MFSWNIWAEPLPNPKARKKRRKMHGIKTCRISPFLLQILDIPRQNTWN
nr:MAG TPA: hypothetical protein [Caudoviricetes sp.]